jgi:hypothetical protein
MPKRNPEDVRKDIEDADLDAEMERVLAMTPEQRRGELEAAGVDLAEVHAKADALYEKMRAKPPAPIPLRPQPNRARVVILVAAVAAIAALVVALMPRLTPNDVATPAPTPPPPPSASASDASAGDGSAPAHSSQGAP